MIGKYKQSSSPWGRSGGALGRSGGALDSSFGTLESSGGTRALLFELLRVAFGRQQRLSRSLSEKEWRRLYALLKRQSVIGIGVYAVSKLPKEQQPEEQMLLEWKDNAAEIYFANSMMDGFTAKAWGRLTKDGLDACILKGQGLAVVYGELAKYRQSGDIDIWVKGGFDKVCEYVQKTYPSDHIDYHHFHYDMFKAQQVEVELHHRPVLMRNPWHNRRLQRWCDSFGKDTFRQLDGKGFAVPSDDFNRIFLVAHAYKHFIFDGIGLRQIMDCYLYLKNTKPGEGEMQRFKEFNMLPFLRAMMWVFAYVFEGVEIKKDGTCVASGEGIDLPNVGDGLPQYPWMICTPDEKEGRFLLMELLQTGNFAMSDKRFRYKHMAKLRNQLRHDLHILTHYPSEIVWIPLWLVWHQVWKWTKKRRLAVLA